MSNIKPATLINYLFLFLVINYWLIVKFLIHIDYTGYGLVFLSILVLFINIKEMRPILHAKPVVYWYIWCIYAVLNYLFQSRTGGVNLIVLYRRVFVPLIAMAIVIKEYKGNSYRLIYYLTIAFLVYTFFGQYWDRGLLYRNESDSSNVLGNAYAITSCFSLFFLAMMNRIGKCKLPFFIILALVIMFLLSVVGTRKAFGAGIIMLVFWIISIYDRNRVGTIFLVVAFFAMGLYGYRYVSSSFFIGERFEYYEEQQEESLPTDAPQFLAIFGDRASHYYYGWKQFLQKPVFGVGIGKSRVGNTFMYVHSEYMVQLTDNGICGFILFVSMYIWILKKIRNLLKNNVQKKITSCLLGGFIAILFLNLTSWMWEFPYYFVCLGVIIAYTKYGIMDSNYKVEKQQVE